MYQDLRGANTLNPRWPPPFLPKTRKYITFLSLMLEMQRKCLNLGFGCQGNHFLLLN